ncbi:MAG TPA: SDR family oxidoreductase [Dehalococcoidia bacterium]|nr:SDR family oxidoreductase [Dehalococcoidia bacterium]
MKLEGKVALVTGASPNIMGGIIEALAAEGAKVACLDVEPRVANAAAAALQKVGSQALPLVCDVSRPEQVEAAVDVAVREFGGIDILVNGAVIQIRQGLLDMALEDWRRQLGVILTGTFLVTKQVARVMIDQQRQGSIINITSTEAHQGNVGNIGYGTCKAGLLNFTRSVAMELSPHAIRVNSLTPTATDPHESIERARRWGLDDYETPRFRQMAAAFDALAAKIPLGRLPAPSDYGKAAVFLASDDSVMITGFDLRVDAGNIAKYWGYDPQQGTSLSLRPEQRA